MTPSVMTGLEVLLDESHAAVAKSRFAILMNEASTNRQLVDAATLLVDKYGHEQLVAIFSPQHGLWGEQQANMIETGHSHDARLDVPIFSLYSETRSPTAEMLQEVELLIIDLQDVGTRVYTYIWTIVNCLPVCAERGIPVLVLDRPNPLGGLVFEGPLLDPDFASFVGGAPIPMRHGLTLGELTLLCNELLKIGADVEVVGLRGWQRSMLFPDTRLPWIAPSPNLPRFESALFYPGQVLLEGTNLSEGRGTTQPFECLGAPYVRPFDWKQHVEARLRDFGIQCRPSYFFPSFDKWSQSRCGGLVWHAADPASVRSYAATLACLATASNLWPEEFQWTHPPYEYEQERRPIDILSGSDALRNWIANCGPDLAGLDELAEVEVGWAETARPFMLY